MSEIQGPQIAPYRFTDARDLFETARKASRDAEQIRQQLETMRERMTSLGGGAMGQRVSVGANEDRMADKVAALVDREQALRRRQSDDYAILDLACAVLYGDEREQGLDKLVPETWWADVLWWRYLDGATWEQVGEAVGYSPRRCFDVAQAALDIADAYGLARTRRGRGIAED